ncbi:amidohydrolase [Caldithrix abyssi DSM 13497]|uniref:Amidohydrolase n=1 Tax=Caldithrix abyssi DSM 13497 TaxID=880073 RepID=H1XV05_CALAY|nr:amidohydrolase family protein [Caldithrix abyssi]APF18875.1 putative selenium metabolism protein SsnA [Caldithrix abyssi DSM 13497]EHO42838.1 amidohydrolase [Caldithrix abyssi DSM 13497]
MASAKIIVKNAWICQLDEQDNVQPVFGDLEIRNGKITRIQPLSAPSSTAPDDGKTLDAGGRMLTVPQVNFHEHIYSRLAKGLPISGPMNNFVQILESLWWKLDRLLDLEMVRASAQMAAIECLQNGVTYLFDHHASPFEAKGSLKTIADALQDFGLRSVMAFEISDRNGTKATQEAIEENVDFIKYAANEEAKGMIGLHALFTLSDETLQTVAEHLSELKAGIHVHVAEDRADVDFNRQKYNKLIAERLRSFNLLNDRSLLIHGVHLTAEDYRIIRESGAALAYNPDSNLNNAVGLPDYGSVPQEIPVLMGTDGMHANVGRSFKQWFLLFRHQGNSFEQAFQRVQKIYKDQLQFVRRYFPDFTRLQADQRADFVIWDYHPPTPVTADNFFGHFLYGLLESPPHAVFQAGRQLTEGRKILRQNSDEIFAHIRQQGNRLYERFKETTV